MRANDQKNASLLSHLSLWCLTCVLLANKPAMQEVDNWVGSSPAQQFYTSSRSKCLAQSSTLKATNFSLELLDLFAEG